jgi:hypothetical protein
MKTWVIRAAIPTALAAGVLLAAPAEAQQALGNYGGDLIVSSSTYIPTTTGFTSGTPLPYNSSGNLSGGSTLNTTTGSAFCTNANCSANVWNNDSTDANFGITSGIYLQDINTSNGNVDNTVNVTQIASAAGINLVTSFSSKSELAINLTPDGTGLTFMGYDATTNEFDASNSNTPAIPESGNTDIQTGTYREVAQLNLSNNSLQVSTTNAYNGNNGRAAILGSNGQYYTVGNAGNGNGGAATTAATGVQIVTPGNVATSSTPGTIQAGSFSSSTAKDNNFRGETIFDNTLYVTKGSGKNGVDTVYQVGTAGTLPTGAAVNTASPVNMTILPGFNTGSANPTTNPMTPHPFGIWFANSTTLYVADEGSGLTTDFGTSPTTQAGGLQKYSLVGGTWQLDYEITGSLIGSSYTVQGAGTLAGDSLTTTVDGLRNLTGTVNANGTVTLYAVTSTVGSVLGDSGADPNEIVALTDTLGDTTQSQAAGENFSVLDVAALGQVYRGVALAPVPLPATLWLLLGGMGGLGLIARKRKLP